MVNAIADFVPRADMLFRSPEEIRPTMDPSRRRMMICLGAGLAGCTRPLHVPLSPLRLDLARLDREFPAVVARARPAFFNAGVLIPSTGQNWVWDPTARMPLQSVSKAPLAAAALAQVDAGHLKLNERIRLTADDLSPPSGPIDAVWPSPPRDHVMDLPAVDLIALAIQQSDNTAADTIMKRIGGPRAVTDWLHSKGVDGMSIDRYERELQVAVAGIPPFQPEWKDRDVWMAARDAVPAETREAATNAYLADPRDTSTVSATLEFLRQLSIGALLSQASTRLLLRLMTQGDTGPHRLRAGLPPGAGLAHKTGTSATDLGLTPTVNDVGIVTLADGRTLVMAAFLAGSSATEAERDRLIADAARTFSGAIL
jgi:beta-lactamase class A